jgi:CheY-like chemotaxis protein
MRKKLLLVNDRRGLARTIGAVAPELGLDVVRLGDAADAVARSAEIAPDVVILDQAIPADEMIELLRGILQAAPGARILIAVRSDDPSTRVAEGMARFHGGERLTFLRRPFTRRRIIAVLQAILGSAVSLLLAAIAIRPGFA